MPNLPCIDFVFDHHYTARHTTIQAIEAIGIDPNIRSGRPYLLAQPSLSLTSPLRALYHGLDAEGIADWYGLNLPQTYAALAYYYAHKPELDDQVRSQIRRAEALKEQRVGAGNSLLSR